jgi:hypothetical protein
MFCRFGLLKASFATDLLGGVTETYRKGAVSTERMTVLDTVPFLHILCVRRLI